MEVINDSFRAFEREIVELDEKDLTTFVKAVNSQIMLMTRHVYSLQSKKDEPFGCVNRREPARVTLEPKERSKPTNSIFQDMRGRICSAGFRVMNRKSKKAVFNLVSLTKTKYGVDHIAALNDLPACREVHLDQLCKNKNYVKGTLTDDLKLQVVQRMLMLKKSDASLGTKRIRLQIDGIFNELGLAACPEHIKRRIEKAVNLTLFGKTETTVLELHSVYNLIKRLEEKKFRLQLMKGKLLKRYIGLTRC